MQDSIEVLIIAITISLSYRRRHNIGASVVLQLINDYNTILDPCCKIHE